MHCLNVLFDRNVWKNVGQLGAVKLLPKLESNGLDSGFRAVGTAVLMPPDATVDDAG